MNIIEIQHLLSARVMTCLLRKRIKTVEELERMTDAELLRIRGFGTVCLKEVRSVIKLIQPAEDL